MHGRNITCEYFPLEMLNTNLFIHYLMSLFVCFYLLMLGVINTTEKNEKNGEEQKLEEILRKEGRPFVYKIN